MNKIKKIIFGINTQISTNNNYFIKFLTNALKNECDFDEKSHLDIDINFDNNFFNSKKNLFKSIDWNYYGSEIYLNDNEIFWNSKNLKVLLKKNDKVSVLAKASLRFDQKMRLFFLNEPEFLNNQFLTVYRFVILYPLFNIISHQNEASVIHASAVKEKESNKASIIIGLNGVGKSTLACKLINHNYDIISDNFVIYQNNKIISVPELIKLPKNMLNYFGSNNLVGKGNKKFLFINSFKSKDLDLDKVIFLKRNNSFSEAVINIISNKKAEQLLHSTSMFLKEYENYHYTAFLNNNKVKIDFKNYKMLSEKKCFSFTIGKENNVSKLLQLLNS